MAELDASGRFICGASPRCANVTLAAIISGDLDREFAALRARVQHEVAPASVRRRYREFIAKVAAASARRPDVTAEAASPARPARHWADQIFHAVAHKDRELAQRLYDEVMRSPRAERRGAYERLLARFERGDHNAG